MMKKDSGNYVPEKEKKFLMVQNQIPKELGVKIELSVSA